MKERALIITWSLISGLVALTFGSLVGAGAAFWITEREYDRKREAAVAYYHKPNATLHDRACAIVALMYNEDVEGPWMTRCLKEGH